MSEDAPSNMIAGAGAGVFQAAYITLTPGVRLQGDELSPYGVARALGGNHHRTGEIVPEQAMAIMGKLQG